MKNNDDALISIIGLPVRAKLIRVFILDKDRIFDVSELAKTLKINSTELKEELNALIEDGIIKEKSGAKIVSSKTTDKIKKVNFNGYSFNRKYIYRTILESLVIQTMPIFGKSIIKAISTAAGPLSLLVTSGLFVRKYDSGADILMVGDSIDSDKVFKQVKELEKVLGRELRVLMFSTNEFMHRYNLKDRLIRDVMDTDSQVHVNNLNIVA